MEWPGKVSLSRQHLSKKAEESKGRNGISRRRELQIEVMEDMKDLKWELAWCV